MWRDVDQSIGFGVTRNTYSAHSKFSENTQAEKVVDRTGKLVGENSSNAQIRTLLDEQRQMIIAEYCEKIGHHELQAARAEEERSNLTAQSWLLRLEQHAYAEIIKQVDDFVVRTASFLPVCKGEPLIPPQTAAKCTEAVLTYRVTQ